MNMASELRSGEDTSIETSGELKVNPIRHIYNIIHYSQKKADLLRWDVHFPHARCAGRAYLDLEHRSRRAGFATTLTLAYGIQHEDREKTAE